MGGELLYIEAVTMSGKGEIKYTGKLGEVMQESIQAAYSYIKSRFNEFNIDPDKYAKTDIHLHVPEGATPKDGPSAGIAITTAIISALTAIPISCAVAMTGEMTLRGRVLPIGGLREKLLAALRGGIHTVIIPQDNEKDLYEIPDMIKKNLKIITANEIDDVIKIALTRQLLPEQAEEAKNKDCS